MADPLGGGAWEVLRDVSLRQLWILAPSSLSWLTGHEMRGSVPSLSTLPPSPQAQSNSASQQCAGTSNCEPEKAFPFYLFKLLS